jgi:hypothetical protein
MTIMDVFPKAKEMGCAGVESPIGNPSRKWKTCRGAQKESEESPDNRRLFVGAEFLKRDISWRGRPPSQQAEIAA